jgi:hypothetical protein
METTMRFDEFCTKVTSSPEYMAIKHLLDMSGRFDAAVDTGQIARALLYVKRTVYEYKYPALRARDFIPVSHDAPAGADSITALMWNQVGQAKIIANHGDDLPRVDASVGEDISPVRTLGDAYAYSVLDLARSAMTGMPLNDRKARAAARGMEQSIEDIAAVGSADEGLGGMLNNANVPIDAATGAWSGLTPVQIISDVSRLVTNMATATSQSEEPDTVLFPTSLWANISQTPYSTLNGMTILKVIQANSPAFITFDRWVKLDTAGAGGVKRIVAYRKDPDVLSLEMPLEFTQLPPQPRNLDFVINCWARTGGVKIMRPLAMRFMDGG